RVFGRNAAQLLAAIEEEFGDFISEINAEKPRRGSFEFTIVKKLDNSTCVWSGIKKGPPRKLKFPEASEVIEAIKAALD
ncbi:hypothetical protein CAPTEDRAFT_101059, partial [Capitella teleta]